jgi:hypothetical protein
MSEVYATACTSKCWRYTLRLHLEVHLLSTSRSVATNTIICEETGCRLGFLLGVWFSL